MYQHVWQAGKSSSCFSNTQCTCSIGEYGQNNGYLCKCRNVSLIHELIF